MLTPLRTPLSFVLLSTAVFGWLAAWTFVPAYTNGPTFDAQYRPAFYLSHLIHGDEPYWKVERTFDHRNSRQVCIALTKNGPDMCLIEQTEHGWVQSGTGESVLSAGFPISTIHSESFGLLAPVVERHSEKIYLVPTEDVPLIDLETAVEGHNDYQFCGNGFIRLPLESQVKIHAFAAVHDSLFLLTLFFWLVSLTAIPKWALWHRITPTQRRRARGCCPRCNYNLEGLTTPTCPECGNRIPPSPLGGEGARAAGG